MYRLSSLQTFRKNPQVLHLIFFWKLQGSTIGWSVVLRSHSLWEDTSHRISCNIRPSTFWFRPATFLLHVHLCAYHTHSTPQLAKLWAAIKHVRIMCKRHLTISKREERMWSFQISETTGSSCTKSLPQKLQRNAVCYYANQVQTKIYTHVRWDDQKSSDSVNII